MKKTLLVSTILLAASSSFALERCVVAAGISYDNGKYTYSIGIGPNGADENVIEVTNDAVANKLSYAVSLDEDHSPLVQVCMEGTDKKLKDGSYTFVATAVTLKSIK